MSIGKNIKALRERAGISQADFGKMLGVTDKAVSTWENETRTPRMGVIQKIADCFGLQKTDIIEDNAFLNIPDNISPLAPMEKIPLVGQIACGTPILAEENITDYVDKPGHITADFALTCKGDSMVNAGILDGDIVYIRRQPQVNNGQIAAVLVGDEATLKRVYYDGRTLQLIPENPRYTPLVLMGEDMESVRVIGLAVAFTHVIRH